MAGATPRLVSTSTTSAIKKPQKVHTALSCPVFWHIDLCLYPSKSSENRKSAFRKNSQNQKGASSSAALVCLGGRFADCIITKQQMKIKQIVDKWGLVVLPYR